MVIIALYDTYFIISISLKKLLAIWNSKYIARKENLTIRKIQKGRGLEADKFNKVIENW